LGAGLAYEQYLAAVGAYQASRRAVDLVDTLIEKADEAHGRKRDATEHAIDHGRTIFYGSPHWKP
jgi:hypothetical protein